MQKVTTVLFILFSMLSFGQNSSYSLEFPVNFSKNNKFNLSKIYNLSIPNNFAFANLSAYSLNIKDDPHLYYRISNYNTWEAWIPLQEDTESLSSKRKVYFTNPIFNGFHRIQFKAENTLKNKVVFRLFITIDDNQTTHLSSETRNCALPEYCDRDCWCPDGDCNPQGDPLYTSPTHIIVHHSGNNYPEDTNYALVVQSYWDYHVNTHGWNDIGYNWLVDPNGIIYEGRGSGIQGAHFSCMNTHTMGVCVIGNFEEATPTSESIYALEDLLAWEATDKNIDVLTSSYHTASQLDLYHISGHLDGNPAPVGCPSGTLCPGMNLYNLLSEIRTEISNYPCYVTASTPEISNTAIVNVYPIPVSNLLYLNWNYNTTSPNINLYNFVGNLIKTSSKTSSIDFSNYKSGIYYLQIQDQDAVQSLKIIKR